MNQKIRKIIMSVLIVTIMLLSTMTAHAGLEESKQIKLSRDFEEDSIPDYDQKQAQNQLRVKPVSSIPKKFAVIMVGRYYGLWKWGNLSYNLERIQDYYTWYLHDAGKMYTTLQDTYGYDNDSIYLLVKLLPPYFTIPDSFNTDWIDYNSTEENLETILNNFKPDGENELSEQDSLLFCFIDHGGNEKVNYYYNDHYMNEFISLDDHIGTNWVNEYKAYDTYSENVHYVYHDTGTGAVFRKIQSGWSDPLILTTDEIKTIKGFRIFAKKKDYFDQMNVTFYNGNEVVKSLTLTKWPNYKYKYVEFEGEEIQVNKVKIRFHENNPNWGFGTNWAVVRDFNIWEVDSCGEVGKTYFGCPLQSIPDFLKWIFGIDVQKLYDFELMFYSNGIKAKMIFVLQPCFSGGFIGELSGENRIVCTASRGFEEADGWFGPFRRALNKIDENGDGIPDADLYPQDGNISILEAYRYAADFVESNHPPGSQHPLIDDNNDGIGHHMYETNYYYDPNDPDNPNRDGSLAADTFL